LAAWISSQTRDRENNLSFQSQSRPGSFFLLTDRFSGMEQGTWHALFLLYQGAEVTGNQDTGTALDKACQRLQFNLMLSHYPARNVTGKTHTFMAPTKKTVLQFLQLVKYTLWVVPTLSHLLQRIRSSLSCETTVDSLSDKSVLVVLRQHHW